MFNNERLKLGKNNNLIFDNVDFAWPNKNEFVLKKCSFALSEPGLWMLVGKNGCGKSTLMKLIKGILKPINGSIRRPSNLALVFQNPDHQILMPTCGSELILNIKGIFNSEMIHKKVNECLFSVGLEDFFKRPIHTLSGGQKQRLAVASALISDSNFILMDEPTALLDQVNRRKILEIVKSLIKNRNNPLTILWITHRLDELVYADKVSVMEKGQLSPWQDPKNFKYI